MAEKDRQIIAGILIAAGAKSHPDFPEVAEHHAFSANINKLWPLLHKMQDKVVDLGAARARRFKPEDQE
jgi:hypothetical protein